MSNLVKAWRKARKGKTKKDYVKNFEENLAYNLKVLHDELKNQTYKPRPLKTFILRDPKTRKISKADFRDRIVHHALCKIIEPIFDRMFIYDSCANRKGKGNLFALGRFYKFVRKVSHNGEVFSNVFLDSNYVKGYCLKCDVRHYFYEIDKDILLGIIKRRIYCRRTINLIKLILDNSKGKKGMPLGNLTSQFFANVYLNELDYFIKHKLRAKYYIRYVDDFILLHYPKEQLKIWKKEINNFLKQRLRLELHSDKSRIINLSKGVDFVGFRNFYYFKLLRIRNITNMKNRITLFNGGKVNHEKFSEGFQGWSAYAMWADSYKLKNNLMKEIN